MPWIAYAVAWLTFALLWALAARDRTLAQALPYSMAIMGMAALMGVGVWRLTARVPLEWRSRRFYGVHLLGVLVFALAFASSLILIEAPRSGWHGALTAAAPMFVGCLVMGTWLYLMIAGGAYALRAHAALRVHEAAAAEARLLAEQAQFAALRAQVNPHFLFNALHSVGALVRTDPEMAEQAIQRLGDLLRYALRAGDEVPFRAEWQFTMDYLALEQLRLGERLRLTAHADDRASSVFVPPLVLQPLVENAVRHGVATRPEGGGIDVSAAVDGDHLVLRVRNDQGLDGHTAGHGVGIASIRKRLSVLHGDRAGIHVVDERSGFSVAVRLPAAGHDDDEDA